EPETRLDVRVDHLAEVHAVDVVGTDHDDDVRLLIPEQVEALEDCVGRPTEPALSQSLLRGHRCHIRVEEAREPPGLRNVTVEAVGLVLGEYDDLAQTRVDQVAQREVDESVTTAERNSG